VDDVIVFGRSFDEELHRLDEGFFPVEKREA